MITPNGEKHTYTYSLPIHTHTKEGVKRQIGSFYMQFKICQKQASGLYEYFTVHHSLHKY